MAVILITGAKGQLGNELRVVSKKYFEHNFIFTDIDTLDITDGNALNDFIEIRKPHWIINCAAYNYVDRAEEEYEKARIINSLAVRNIVSVIRDSSCRLVHISSDYVFDGRSQVPYRENDPASPVSAYGRSKLEGERFALLHPGTMVLRTSWLYSSFGHNFLKTILHLSEEKESLRIVNDQTGSPTWAADLAQAILDIIAGVNNHQIAFNSGIYHYSNEGSCTWYEFAKAITDLSGRNIIVSPVTTEEYGLPAARPRYSVLSKTRITENYRIAIPHWRTSLEKCILLMKKSGQIE